MIESPGDSVTSASLQTRHFPNLLGVSPAHAGGAASDQNFTHAFLAKPLSAALLEYDADACSNISMAASGVIDLHEGRRAAHLDFLLGERSIKRARDLESDFGSLRPQKREWWIPGLWWGIQEGRTCQSRSILQGCTPAGYSKPPRVLISNSTRSERGACSFLFFVVSRTKFILKFPIWGSTLSGSVTVGPTMTDWPIPGGFLSNQYRSIRSDSMRFAVHFTDFLLHFRMC